MSDVNGEISVVMAVLAAQLTRAQCEVAAGELDYRARAGDDEVTAKFYSSVAHALREYRALDDGEVAA